MFRDIVYKLLILSIIIAPGAALAEATGDAAAWYQRAIELREAEDLEALVRFLTREGKPFFIYPDFTFLYGAVGVTPPQPLLWFRQIGYASVNL